MPITTRLLLLGLSLAGPAGVAGCQSYVLYGKVTGGSLSTMSLVEPDDPRLAEPGVQNVQITVHRDPDRLAIRRAGRTISDARGAFAVKLDEFGAGWMVEEWLVIASRRGFETAQLQLRIPSRRDPRQLLIILAPGVSEDPNLPDDLIEQYERFR